MNDILQALLWVGYAYAATFFTWVFYLAVMNLARHRDTMHPVAKVHGYVLLYIGVVMDFVINVVVGSVLFLKLPQDGLLTGRLKRYIRDPNERPWRRSLAKWLCSRLLDQFDPSGPHCR